MLHPTLAPYDPDGPQALVRATRSLNAVLPQLTFVKFSLQKNQQFYQRDLAAEMMAYFRSNNWHGALPTLGNSTMLALLTRLAGGMGAWKGDAKLTAKREEKARLKLEVKECARKEREAREREKAEEAQAKKVRRVQGGAYRRSPNPVFGSRLAGGGRRPVAQSRQELVPEPPKCRLGLQPRICSP